MHTCKKDALRLGCESEILSVGIERAASVKMKVDAGLIRAIENYGAENPVVVAEGDLEGVHSVCHDRYDCHWSSRYQTNQERLWNDVLEAHVYLQMHRSLRLHPKSDLLAGVARLTNVTDSFIYPETTSFSAGDIEGLLEESLEWLEGRRAARFKMTGDRRHKRATTATDGVSVEEVQAAIEKWVRENAGGGKLTTNVNKWSDTIEVRSRVNETIRIGPYSAFTRDGSSFTIHGAHHIVIGTIRQAEEGWVTERETISTSLSPENVAIACNSPEEALQHFLLGGGWGTEGTPTDLESS